MTPEHWARAKHLFAQVVERSEAEQEMLLAEADPAVRKEVESMLAAHRAAESFMERPFLGESPDESPDAVGVEVGPWRIIAPVGRGGMGDVYRAERADGQYQQHAALKLVRRGMDSEAVLARFRQERQILAGLVHPGVARLLDGGIATDGPFDGQPYLAMEYIEGEPITAYCDRHRLSVPDRLRLFVGVGEAVAAAHRHLVVHRDLKPSNVLVTTDGTGRPVSKLLDFGIAKLLSDGDAETGPLTRTGVRVLTPEYAAPEQILGEDITTATDVYSLGTLLYELLTGQRPMLARGRSVRALEQAVLETEPERPSTAITHTEADTSLSSMHTASPEEVAAARQTEPERLRRMLSGDLDAICLKALRKEPDARYSGATAFVDDVKRYLDGLPVEARRGSRSYYAKKTLARHRGKVAALGLGLILTAGFGVFYTAGITEERDRAEAEAAKAQEVASFLAGLFEAARPEEAQGDTLTAFDLLERGVDRAEALAAEPAVQAQMLGVLGRTYHTLSRYDEAETLLERSLALSRPIAPDSVLVRRLNHLGSTRMEQAKFEAAEPLFDEALVLSRTLDDGGAATAATLNNLGALHERKGNYDDALAAHREALTIHRRLFGTSDPRLAPSLNNLAFVHASLDDYDAAIPLYREVLTLLRRAHGDLHPQVIATLANLGAALRRATAYDDAEATYQEALALSRRLHGNDHFATASLLNNLGVVLRRTGRLDEAEVVYTDALATRRRIFGEDHPQVATTLNNLGALFRAREAYDRAEPLYRESLAIYRHAYGPGHPLVARGHTNLGLLLFRMGLAQEAEASLREALAIEEAARAPNPSNLARTRRYLGEVLLNDGRLTAALPLLQKAHAAYEQRGSADATAVDSLLTLLRSRLETAG